MFCQKTISFLLSPLAMSVSTPKAEKQGGAARCKGQNTGAGLGGLSPLPPDVLLFCF